MGCVEITVCSGIVSARVILGIIVAPTSMEQFAEAKNGDLKRFSVTEQS